jgi:hypothetical protein
LNYGYLLKRKPHYSGAVEAIDPFHMAPSSMINAYQVNHNPHMLWMSI